MTKHTPTREIEEAALQTAQHDYAEELFATPGIRTAEVELDLQRIHLIALYAAQMTDRAWREYRQTHDFSPLKREFTTAEVALQIAEVLSEAFDFSPEATRVLEAAVRVECSQ